MSLPTPVKTWTYGINNRITYVSLNDAMATLLYGLKTFLVSTMGWTVKYTCDGTTGPTSSTDHTDRWASKANCTTRGTLVTNAQAFAVLTDGNGCDMLFAYQGTSDDLARIAVSVSGVFLPAATPNQQPTATDQMDCNPATQTLISNTTSGDRLWHAMASTDKKLLRVFVYRASVMVVGFGLELITKEPAVAANVLWNGVVGWGTFNSGTTGPFIVTAGSAIGSGSAAGGSGVARINNITAFCGGSGECMNGLTGFTVASPELQAATVFVPIGYATSTANVAGKLGQRIDVWTNWSSLIGQGDTFGTLNFVYFGTLILPWDGASTPVIA